MGENERSNTRCNVSKIKDVVNVGTVEVKQKGIRLTLEVDLCIYNISPSFFFFFFQSFISTVGLIERQLIAFIVLKNILTGFPVRFAFFT